MELKWLDDYIALIETGSFSAAAEKRHVSQPAFSRRIQQLEEWLGVALVDRARKPLTLTPVAVQHEEAFRNLATRLYEFRAGLKSQALGSPGFVIAAQHSLAAAYLPTFLAQLNALDASQNYRIRSENRDSGVALLMRGQADILVSYERLDHAIDVPPQWASALVLGQDALVLVASAKLCESPLFFQADHPLPLLCFPPESFFGRAVRTHALPELMRERQVMVQYTSEFSLGLREMALMHQGAAWLPRSLIAGQLAQGLLHELTAVGRSIPLHIVGYFSTQGSVQLQELRERYTAAYGL